MSALFFKKKFQAFRLSILTIIWATKRDKNHSSIITSLLMTQPFYAIFFSCWLITSSHFPHSLLCSSSHRCLIPSPAHLLLVFPWVLVPIIPCIWGLNTTFFSYPVSGIYHVQPYLSKDTDQKRNTGSLCCQWSEGHALRDIYTFPYTANYNFIRFVFFLAQANCHFHDDKNGTLEVSASFRFPGNILHPL